MEDLKLIVAHNLVELRKSRNFTQLELAKKLNYSDKAISKWEKGESLPDIEVLYRISELYGITLDYLVHDGTKEDLDKYKKEESNRKNKIVITALFISIVWLITIIFFTYYMFDSKIVFWPIFIWALPASFLCLIFFNIKWGKRKYEIIISTPFIWTLITAIHIQVIYSNGQNIWPLYLVGIPLQISAILLSQLK